MEMGRNVNISTNFSDNLSAGALPDPREQFGD